MTFNEKYPGETLRALSWKQPFASLMLHGKVETRVWDTKYRGWVLICASKAPYPVLEFADIVGDQGKRVIETLGLEIVKARGNYKFFLDKDKMPLAKAIAIGRLVSSKKMDGFAFVRGLDQPNITYSEMIERKTFVKYNADLWCHSYADVQPIVPFEWHGSQGWRTVDEETKSKIILL